MQKGFSLTLLGVKKVELVNIVFVLLLFYLIWVMFVYWGLFKSIFYNLNFMSKPFILLAKSCNAWKAG